MEMKAAILAAQGKPLVIDSVQLPRIFRRVKSSSKSTIPVSAAHSRHDRWKAGERSVSATPART